MPSGFLDGAVGKESICQCGRRQKRGLNPWVRKIPWRRKWQPTPVSLPRKFHKQRSLADTIHGVTKSQTQLGAHSHVCRHTCTLRMSSLTYTSLMSSFCVIHFRDLFLQSNTLFCVYTHIALGKGQLDISYCGSIISLWCGQVLISFPESGYCLEREG